MSGFQGHFVWESGHEAPNKQFHKYCKKDADDDYWLLLRVVITFWGAVP